MYREKLEYYCNLDKKIFLSDIRKKELNKTFYDKSFTTHVAYTVNGLSVQGADIENRVLDYIEQVERTDKTQEQRKRLYKAFKPVCDSLAPHEREYLSQRYIRGLNVDDNSDIERKVLKEIRRIERGVKQQRKEELTRWVKKEIEKDEQRSKEKSLNEWHKQLVQEHLNTLQRG